MLDGFADNEPPKRSDGMSYIYIYVVMHVASCRHMSKCNVWYILLEYLQEDIENDPWRPSASSVPRADWNGSWDNDGAIGA